MEKITTDIFDDEKILLIESLPEADSMIVIWFKLLCLAGKMNNSGVFMLNDKIAYTDKMLATIFCRKEATVQLALKTFEQFGMVEIVDGVITVPNWGKHQNLDQLESKKAYMKGYMQEYRKKQKTLAEGKPNCKTNSKTNVSSADKEGDKDIDKEEDGESTADKPPTPARKEFSRYGWVKLTQEEYDRLVADWGETEAKRCIAYVDESAQSTRNKNKWKDWNLVVRRCHRDGWGKISRHRAAEEAKCPIMEVLTIGVYEHTFFRYGSGRAGKSRKAGRL